MALFLGEHDDDWTRIWVEDLLIPLTQIRGEAHVRIPEDWNPSDALAPYVVGVVHLHPGRHNHGYVGFSSIDTGRGGLNERWPMSMVVGKTAYSEDPEGQTLGFGYEIYGRAVLPCGADGTIQYMLHPSQDGKPDEAWPWPRQVLMPKHEKGTKFENLGDCPRYKPSEDSTRYSLQRQGNCGIVETDTNLVESAFGETGDGILHNLPPVPGKRNYRVDDRRSKYYDSENGRYWESESEAYPKLKGWSV